MKSDYERGFEHAVRNIVAAIERQVRKEGNPDRKLGLHVALDTANSYHGFISEAAK